MSDPGSITVRLPALAQGDPEATRFVWERYYRRLVGLARKKLRECSTRVADEEDAVQEAFCSFFRRAQAGLFPELKARDNLWCLLVVITARKVRDQISWQRRKKRNPGAIRTETQLGCLSSELADPNLQLIIGTEPSPEFAAQVTEMHRHLMESLGDDELRQVAQLKMEGHTNEEITAWMDMSLSTVARNLRTIRKRWKKALSTA